jgi:hypothetical protein
MKNIKLTLFAAVLIAFSCKEENQFKAPDTPDEVIMPKTTQQNQVEDKTPRTTVSFDKMIHDFGDVKEGETVETQFKITNTGKNDLIIIEAKGSCGCTVPEVTKEPIKPGASETISVKFDTKGKQGNVTKSVNIKCNTENYVEQVKITANVLTLNKK